jgi:hypothetical protein
VKHRLRGLSRLAAWVCSCPCRGLAQSYPPAIWNVGRTFSRLSAEDAALNRRALSVLVMLSGAILVAVAILCRNSPDAAGGNRSSTTEAFDVGQDLEAQSLDPDRQLTLSEPMFPRPILPGWPASRARPRRETFDVSPRKVRLQHFFPKNTAAPPQPAPSRLEPSA